MYIQIIKFNMTTKEQSIELAIKDIERLRTIYTRNYRRIDKDLMENTHFSIKNVLNGVLVELLYTEVYKNAKMQVVDFNETIKNMSKVFLIKKVDTFQLFGKAISILMFSLKELQKENILKKF